MLPNSLLLHASAELQISIAPLLIARALIDFHVSQIWIRDVSTQASKEGGNAKASQLRVGEPKGRLDYGLWLALYSVVVLAFVYFAFLANLGCLHCLEQLWLLWFALRFSVRMHFVEWAML
jgi:hypothetical protein